MNTGGPAFPLHNHGAQTLGMHIAGMTLRDYFAAKAMSSLYKEYAECARSTGWGADWPMAIALDAYAMADAMLKARAS